MQKSHDTRTQSRRVAVQLLFNLLYTNNSEGKISLIDDEELREINDNLKENKKLTEQLIEGVNKYRDQINKVISELAPERPLDEISKVNLLILQIAIYEGFISESVPYKVSIDEALEIARDFGNETDVKFVNGVLGSLVNNLDKFSQNLKK